MLKRADEAGASGDDVEQLRVRVREGGGGGPKNDVASAIAELAASAEAWDTARMGAAVERAKALGATSSAEFAQAERRLGEADAERSALAALDAAMAAGGDRTGKDSWEMSGVDIEGVVAALRLCEEKATGAGDGIAKRAKIRSGQRQLALRQALRRGDWAELANVVDTIMLEDESVIEKSAEVQSASRKLNYYESVTAALEKMERATVALDAKKVAYSLNELELLAVARSDAPFCIEARPQVAAAKKLLAKLRDVLEQLKIGTRDCDADMLDEALAWASANDFDANAVTDAKKLRERIYQTFAALESAVVDGRAAVSLETLDVGAIDATALDKAVAAATSLDCCTARLKKKLAEASIMLTIRRTAAQADWAALRQAVDGAAMAGLSSAEVTAARDAVTAVERLKGIVETLMSNPDEETLLTTLSKAEQLLLTNDDRLVELVPGAAAAIDDGKATANAASKAQSKLQDEINHGSTDALSKLVAAVKMQQRVKDATLSWKARSKPRDVAAPKLETPTEHTGQGWQVGNSEATLVAAAPLVDEGKAVPPFCCQNRLRK